MISWFLYCYFSHYQDTILLFWENERYIFFMFTNICLRKNMYLSYLSVINICHYVLVYHHVLHFQKTIYSTIHLYTQLCISVSRTKHMHHILSCFPITSFILRQKEMSLITLLFTLRINKGIGAPRLIFILFPICKF